MKNLKMKSLVIGLVFVIVLLFAVAPTQAQVLPTVTTTYAAKFICGFQKDDGVNSMPDAQAGRYSSKINVHNNTGVLINFRKKIIRLEGGQKPIKPQYMVKESLKPDYAMEVVCKDIYQHLNINLDNQSPPPYIEGFVIFEVYFTITSTTPKPPLDPLDVAGIYTYKGDFPSLTGGSGVSIDIEVYPAKNNNHTLQ